MRILLNSHAGRKSLSTRPVGGPRHRAPGQRPNEPSRRIERVRFDGDCFCFFVSRGEPAKRTVNDTHSWQERADIENAAPDGSSSSQVPLKPVGAGVFTGSPKKTRGTQISCPKPLSGARPAGSEDPETSSRACSGLFDNKALRARRRQTARPCPETDVGCDGGGTSRVRGDADSVAICWMVAPRL